MAECNILFSIFKRKCQSNHTYFGVLLFITCENTWVVARRATTTTKTLPNQTKMLPQFSSMANGIKSILHLFTLSYCYSLQCVWRPPPHLLPPLFSLPPTAPSLYISHVQKSFPFFWFLLSFSSFRSRPFCVYIFFLVLLFNAFQPSRNALNTTILVWC